MRERWGGGAVFRVSLGFPVSLLPGYYKIISFLPQVIEAIHIPNFVISPNP